MEAAFQIYLDGATNVSEGGKNENCIGTLPDGRKSGLKDALRILKNVPDIAQVRFSEKDVVRHRLVQEIIKAYEKSEEGRR